jgi:hypothetical protein
MKAILIIFTFLLIICFTGCNKESSDSQQPVINSYYIQELVLKAISGDSASNSKLSNIINMNYPVNKSYNKLTVDSIMSKGKTFYYILLDYSKTGNPAYNRFAVYDKNLNLYLLDKSLNGELSFGSIVIDGILFGKMIETFISKDVLVMRLSFYKFGDSSVSLSFRTLTSFNSPKLWITQEIKSLQKDTIITFNTSHTEGIKKFAAGDTFIYKPASNSYSGKNNSFSNFIISELKNMKGNPGYIDIVDEKSFKLSVGGK